MIGLESVHHSVAEMLGGQNVFSFLLLHGSILIFIELAFYSVIGISSLVVLFRTKNISPCKQTNILPKVSCVLTCYGEGMDIINTIKSLILQTYEGEIEILVIIDAATQNMNTVNIAKSFVRNNQLPKNRSIIIYPKWKRGGVVSSCNLGLVAASGEIISRLDGDTACCSTTISKLVSKLMSDENVIACSGTIFARNGNKNILTKLQDLEYKIAIHFNRIGFSNLGYTDIISGAFGGFKAPFLRKMGGWKNGSSEDLDLTIRLHALKTRYPEYKISHADESIVYTDVPENWISLFKQRMRWDGDLFYISFKRNKRLILPRFIGWKNFTLMSISSLFFSMGMTLAIPVYMLYLYFEFGALFLAGIFVLIYLYYFIFVSFIFSVYILLLSKSKLYDLKLLLCVPFFPIYNFLIRLISFFAIISELIFATHKDTSLAPEWVLKKVD
tara:strand:+ start:2314 stop:3642 length:1329 start_codon:yes stop_codon:yes gene_type:complete